MLGAAPEVASLVRDLLSADLIGFQTDNDLTNFAAAAQSLTGAVRVSSTVLLVAVGVIAWIKFRPRSNRGQ